MRSALFSVALILTAAICNAEEVNRMTASSDCSLEQLTTTISAPAQSDLLLEWKWLTGPDKKLFMASLSGDGFLSDPSGAVWWLNTGEAKLSKIASSRNEFQELLKKKENKDLWLMYPLICQFIRSGKVPLLGQCFGFKTLPVLGGKYDADNMIPIKMSEHFGVTGDIHQQIKDLPEGTTVEIKVVD